MSGFFDGIHNGVRQPDVSMNNGPLPPSNPSAPPVGINGTPDARINMSDTLLGGVEAYSYGEADRLSTQTAYLNVPHTVQRVIPQLWLPAANNEGLIPLSHQVGNGELAFVMRMVFYQSPSSLDQEFIQGRKVMHKHNALHAVDAILNLADVNYILFGIQMLCRRLIDGRIHQGTETEWIRLCASMGLEIEKYATDAKSDGHALPVVLKTLVSHIVRSLITPLGMCKGSQAQGGQHQGTYNRSVAWPVDYVSSIVVDGKVIQLSNIWCASDIYSGDSLSLELQQTKLCPTHTYTLTNYPKSLIQQTFGGIDPLSDEQVFQLMPRVRATQMPSTPDAWHIATSQQMQHAKKAISNQKCYTDATASTNTNLLTATISIFP